MSMITGTQIEDLDGNFSERTLNYAFMKEFVHSSNDDEWLDWVSNQLGYSESQPADILLKRLDQLIDTSKKSHKFGL